MMAFYRLIIVSINDNVNHYTIVQKVFEIVIFLRLLKFFNLLYEIKTLRVIIETIRNLVKPLS
jgi:hypothetical protein